MQPAIVDIVLAVRPRGSADWVSIDPTSPTGQAFARRLGFTTPSKEDTMSAVAIEQPTTTRHLRVVENNVEQMGLLLKARAAARSAYDYVTTLPKAAWAWMKRTFHLDPALGFAADGVRWVRTKATVAARFLGTTGFAGAGLLAVSTDAGRRIVSTLLKPIGWAARLLERAWVWAEDALATDDKDAIFAGARNMIANRLADVREFFVTKMLYPSAIFVGKRIYPLFKIDSPQMQVARTAGTALLGYQMLPLVALIPLGGFAVAGQYLATAGVLALTANAGWGLIESVITWVKARFAKVEEIAVGDTPGADVVDLVQTAAETGTIVANAAGGTPPRAARRAQKRAAGKGSRS